jgi:hypothetical protein
VLGFKTITKERKGTGLHGKIIRKRIWGNAPRTMGGWRAKEIQDMTGAMAHICNPSYSGERNLEGVSLRPAWEKVSKVSSQSISWVWWKDYLKSKPQRVGDVAQVVKCLPRNMRLWSNTATKQKERKVRVSRTSQILCQVSKLGVFWCVHE